MRKPRPDRSGYTDLSTIVRIVRPACPKCGVPEVANEGVHAGIGYYACDGCHSRFKATIAYIEKDSKLFRMTEPSSNYPTR